MNGDWVRTSLRVGKKKYKVAVGKGPARNPVVNIIKTKSSTSSKEGEGRSVLATASAAKGDTPTLCAVMVGERCKGLQTWPTTATKSNREEGEGG